MKFCVIGPGAVGCLFGGYLAQAGFETVLLDHLPERAKMIQQRGIIVEGIRGDFQVPVKAVLQPEDAGLPDVVLVCVKAYDTAGAALSARKLVRDGTLVVTLQNGLGNVEELSRALDGMGTIVAGTTTQGATSQGEGHVRHAGEGDTTLGVVDSAGKAGDDVPNLKELIQCFEKAGFPTKTADNINDIIWSKLIVNVGINALTAITRLKNGELIQCSGTERVMERAVNEALEVAGALGVKPVFPDPLAQVKKVCELTAGNISSMLQDVLKGKKTEIAFINGAIVREAERCKVATPTNACLTELVLAIQETYDRQLFGP